MRFRGNEALGTVDLGLVCLTADLTAVKTALAADIVSKVNGEER